tara:strand:+ start:9130 stop:9450 length:321 start_codon:yes stop_codon:yes gene_type:complete
MGTQLEGNRMKKPQKMKMGGMLAMLSPAAALVKSLRSGKAEGILGMTPVGAMYNDGRKKRDPDNTEGPTGPAGPAGPKGVTGMKAGGRVSRGDGACMKGHTKGKMR